MLYDIKYIKQTYHDSFHIFLATNFPNVKSQEYINIRLVGEKPENVLFISGMHVTNISTSNQKRPTLFPEPKFLSLRRLRFNDWKRKTAPCYRIAGTSMIQPKPSQSFSNNSILSTCRK